MVMFWQPVVLGKQSQYTQYGGHPVLMDESLVPTVCIIVDQAAKNVTETIHRLYNLSTNLNLTIYDTMTIDTAKVIL